MQVLPPPVAGTDFEPPAATAERRRSRRTDLEVGVLAFIASAAATFLLLVR
jgi:hypothetical protein